MAANDVLYSALRQFFFIMFVMLGVAAGGILLGLGFPKANSINLLNPEKNFVAIDEGCNITDVTYKFIPENELEYRNQCADSYSYTFSTVTDPQVSYLDEETKVKSCKDDRKYEASLKVGRTPCWKSRPNLHEKNRIEIRKYYDCIDEHCTKVVDPHKLLANDKELKGGPDMLLAGIIILSVTALVGVARLISLCRYYIKKRYGSAKQPDPNPMVVAHSIRSAGGGNGEKSLTLV